MPSGALRSRRGCCVGTTVLALAGSLVFTLGLSVAPNLPAPLRPTAAPLHECAVTLIASGCCHHTVAPPLVIAPATPVQSSNIPPLNAIWVESPFLGACIFEHAPPHHS